MRFGVRLEFWKSRLQLGTNRRIVACEVEAEHLAEVAVGHLDLTAQIGLGDVQVHVRLVPGMCLRRLR